MLYEVITDLGAAIKFYEHGLGFPRMESPPEVAFFTLNGTWLGLYGREARITSYNVCYTKLLRAPIGHATSAILPGDYVHVQNTKTNLSGTMFYEFNQKLNELPYRNQSLTYKGFKRSNENVV